MEKIKILLDTDIGNDIDDAVCLAYLLTEPRCDLLGITTVSGEADRRAMMADAMCRQAGREIPIHVGLDEPLAVPNIQPIAKQAVKLECWPHATSFQRDAIAFMADTIQKHPGEITLLGIGPMTNLATLFTEYPEVGPMLRGLVLMLGAFFEGGKTLRPQGEWNSRCDPKAAEIVLQAANIPVLRAVGLDVTRQVVYNRAQMYAAFTAPIFRMATDFAEVWFAKQEISCMHDPLTAMGIFHEGLMTYKRGRVTVDASMPESCVLNFEENAEGSLEAAYEVRVDRFKELLLERAGQA